MHIISTLSKWGTLFKWRGHSGALQQLSASWRGEGRKVGPGQTTKMAIALVEKKTGLQKLNRKRASLQDNNHRFKTIAAASVF